MPGGGRNQAANPSLRQGGRLKPFLSASSGSVYKPALLTAAKYRFRPQPVKR